MKKHKNVLVALGWYDHRLLQGIASYASQHSWHIAAHSIIHEKEIPWGWEGHGVLAWLAAGDDLAKFVLSVKKPTVDFSLRRPHLPFAHVVQDHEKTGRLVAEYFLQRGFKHFSFYSDSPNWSHLERGASFQNHLRLNGHTLFWWKWSAAPEHGAGRASWLKRRQWLRTQLKEAPKPLALFTANGNLAVEVQELCEDCGISVPGDVAIVGIDDYLLSVGAHNQFISGVDTNLEEQGYQGAALLDRMMRSGRIPSKPQRIAPAGIITRKSSDILAVHHRGVARAIQFINSRFGAPVSMADVAQAAGMSVRGLHQAFADHLVSTPGALLNKTRIDHALRLLSQTDHKIELIAQQSGYSSLNTFFIAFKKTVKMTPAEFRRVSRRGR